MKPTPNKAQAITAQLQLHDYPQAFQVARQLNRTIHFHLGPTNSGKTHDALIQLQQASSGVYLAPLRLLAMEIRDRLIEAGVPCNLITGEERQLMPGAKHTACTIEMMNPTIAVEVAIIDEIQMLQDPARGHAWTAALVGAPAKQVYVCGANSVTAPCLRLIEALNENYTIQHLERKTPLILQEDALSGRRYNRWNIKKHLQKGDAVIAFSRKDVLTLSARFRQWGFGVASIYGALSPEVRRTESKRFSSGEAEILVATDAIGMGLNLPIQRVIFSTIEKFDGVASRLINATEARQIAGRAGRFGIYPTGFVNAFEQDELTHLSHMLSTSDVTDLDKLPIAPNAVHLEEVARHLHTHKLSELLAFFAERISLNNPFFEIATSAINLQQAQLIDAYAPTMSLNHKFICACAPVSLDKANERDYFLSCLQSIAHHQTKTLPENVDWLDANNPKYLEEAEHLTQAISLYAWLAYKFPRIFIAQHNIPLLRTQTSRYIERALLIQAGYQDTSKELMYQRSRY